MSRILDIHKAALAVDMDDEFFKRVIRTSDNPPPHFRISSKIIAFHEDELLQWRNNWVRAR